MCKYACKYKTYNIRNYPQKSTSRRNYSSSIYTFHVQINLGNIHTRLHPLDKSPTPTPSAHPSRYLIRLATAAREMLEPLWRSIGNSRPRIDLPSRNFQPRESRKNPGLAPSRHLRSRDLSVGTAGPGQASGRPPAEAKNTEIAINTRAKGAQPRRAGARWRQMAAGRGRRAGRREGGRTRETISGIQVSRSRAGARAHGGPPPPVLRLCHPPCADSFARDRSCLLRRSRFFPSGRAADRDALRGWVIEGEGVKGGGVFEILWKIYGGLSV